MVKAAQNGGKKVAINSLFFITGQISMKFGLKRHSCALLSLNRRILKMFP